MEELRERLKQFALSLHPDKTRLIEFGRHAARRRARRGLGKPETFNFLGFTHICGQSRRGHFLLKRKTRRDRMRTTLQALKNELRQWMHRPLHEQGTWLGQVVRGYFAYHAIPTNAVRLGAFRHDVVALWRRALRRRSQKDARPGAGSSASVPSSSLCRVSCIPGQTDAFSSPEHVNDFETQGVKSLASEG